MPGHCFKASIRLIGRAVGLLLLAQVSLVGTSAQQFEARRQLPLGPPLGPIAPQETLVLAPDYFRGVDLTTYSEIVSDRLAQPPRDRTLASQPLQGPAALRVHANPKAFLSLSAGVYTMALLDMEATVTTPGWRSYEKDPLVKPFMHLPTPLYIAGGVGLATGINWLGWKMGHSHRWHNVWWLPQACSIAANVYGYQETRRLH
jgi:hypothetical protein